MNIVVYYVRRFFVIIDYVEVELFRFVFVLIKNVFFVDLKYKCLLRKFMYFCFGLGFISV